MSKSKFILSKNKVLEQYNKIKKLADKISYSSKTNPLITGILEETTDCMFSIHLKNELKNIKNMKRVIFLAQGWDSETIKELLDLGIKNFIVDNETDLNILLNNLDVKINLSLRVKLQEMTIKTERSYLFGMDSKTVNERIRNIPKINIEKLGIHFHRKTQNVSEWRLIYEIENMFDEDVLKLIDSINIGGGIPSSYANTNENVLNVIFDKIRETKKWLNGKNIEMILEPGRFIAAPSVKLITEIVNIYENTIVVDASVYNSDMDALIVPVKLLIEGELEHGKKYIVKGITPCSLDLFRYKVFLNEKKIGDKLTFLNAGAYNFNTRFCNLDKVKTIIKN